MHPEKLIRQTSPEEDQHLRASGVEPAETRSVAEAFTEARR